MHIGLSHIFQVGENTQLTSSKDINTTKVRLAAFIQYMQISENVIIIIYNENTYNLSKIHHALVITIEIHTHWYNFTELERRRFSEDRRICNEINYVMDLTGNKKRFLLKI